MLGKGNALTSGVAQGERGYLRPGKHKRDPLQTQAPLFGRPCLLLQKGRTVAEVPQALGSDRPQSDQQAELQHGKGEMRNK